MAIKKAEQPGSDKTKYAIEASQVGKSYGDLRAVDRLDLSIPEAQFFGLLGPNGSGKTTTLHMLSTLIRPTEGTLSVAGYDVVKSPVSVRRAIGLVFQESALDRNLTVDENLRFVGALYNLPEHVVRERSQELLELFDLTTRRHARVGTLSGGLRRTLDIARGVLHRPRVLLLDEPTIGLDVINRRTIWRFIERLRQEENMTVLLTTHYLEEAEGCDQVAFIRKGNLIGQGKPKMLIQSLGAYILEIESEAPDRHAELLNPTLGTPVQEGNRLMFCVPNEDFPVAELQRELKSAVHALHLRRPDLNDVYIWLNRQKPRTRR
ncbi:MAG: ATP-binding cassette domain-containing protein [Gammaproteobacteria bacterium]|nr:ATP-binding cassette domain-containing protein [Gammaproteobacteria bacterium]